jgi:hypothetical protein
MAEMALKLFDEMLDNALAQVEEPPAHSQMGAGVRPGYVQTTLTALLQEIAGKFSLTRPKRVNLCRRRNAAEKPAARAILCRNTRPNVGVFPLAANPVHWGHVIASLSAINALDLDVMVLMPAGGGDGNERDRHAMVQGVTNVFGPILQYTDVTCGTNAPGECAVHDLLALNYHGIDFNLIWLAESELRIRRIMVQSISCLRDKSLLRRESYHHLDLTFIDGIGTKMVLFDPERLWRYQREIGLQLRCQLITIDMPELAPFRSFYYRDSREAALVPRAVHRYVLDRNLYP